MTTRIPRGAVRALTATLAASATAAAFAPGAGAQQQSDQQTVDLRRPRPATACSTTATQPGEWVLDQEAVVNVETYLDEDCRSTVSRKVTRNAERSPVRLEGPGLDVRASGGDVQAAATVYGNIIQSSQTLQDVINIDIAKFRYGHDRVWNGSQTRMKASVRWAYGQTGVAWNHPVGAWFDLQETAWATEARGVAHGDFHSDFLWCNFQPGQNFSMKSTLTSRRDGGRKVDFTQSATCSGTHMATAHKTSTTPGAWS